jgi:four helix bundle protein
MSNIAEGFDRYSKKEFINFLVISRGSISEVQNDLFIAKDLNYINDNEFQETYKDSKKIAKQVNGLIKYLRTNGKTFSNK